MGGKKATGGVRKRTGFNEEEGCNQEKKKAEKVIGRGSRPDRKKFGKAEERVRGQVL